MDGTRQRNTGTDEANEGMPDQAARRDSLSVALTGSGGAGILTAGGMLLEAAARAGWYGLMTRSVGPQIRGGETAAMVRLSPRPVEARAAMFELLIAVDWHNIESFAAEIPLGADSLVIVDPAAGEVPESIAASGARIAALAMKEIAKDIPGGRVNMVALGAAAGLVGLPEATVVEIAAKKLDSKGPDAIRASIAGIRAGLAAAPALGPAPRLESPENEGAERWIISGNEAAGLGAVRGGVRFVAAYPITPATEILEWLAPALARVGGTLVQAEDELASINMAIGASYGGKPSLTATSGPGLALMSESIGLATAAEVPVVVVDVMRGGPSTGLPTKSEQADLNIAVYGLHGDAPHLVVAPNSVADCLFATQWAVHLAEALQAPALVLSDQFLGQARAVVDRPGEIAFFAKRQTAPAETELEAAAHYRRYEITESGVSPMALPGTPGCQYTADGLEHSPRGTPSGRAADHLAQLDKRLAKLEDFDYGEHWAVIEGEGDFAILTWGSSTGPSREAAARRASDGVEVKLIALRLLAPAQPERLAAVLAGVARVLVVEQTHSGQFYRYLRAHYDLPGEIRCLRRPGPLPLGADEIHAGVTEWRQE